MKRTALFLAALCGALLVLEAATFSDRLLITSAGQSNDLLIARQIFLRAGCEEPRVLAKAHPDSLKGVETLVVVAGGSSKGLGQAKDATDLELDRVQGLIEAAAERRIRLVCLHLGRETRRGVLSDRFIEPAALASSQIIVLEGGNQDSLFTRLSREHDIPLIEAMDYVDVVQHVNRLFGWKMPED